MPAIHQCETDYEHIMRSWRRDALEHHLEWKYHDVASITSSSSSSTSSSTSATFSKQERQQPRWQQRRLTFSPIIDVRVIPTREEYTSNELVDMYYDDEQFFEFQMNIHRTVKRYSADEEESSNDESFQLEDESNELDCLRGCEMGNPPYLQERRKIIRETRAAIQKEMIRQAEGEYNGGTLDHYDAGRLRAAYQWFSVPSLSKAHRQALKDESEIQDYVRWEQDNWFHHSNSSLESFQATLSWRTDADDQSYLERK